MISKQPQDSLPLIQFISNFYPLTHEMIDFIQQNTQFKKFKKGKILLKAGDTCQEYYFIHKGILRSYLKFGNKIITTWINPENEITTAIRCMSQNRVSEEYIEVLEDCELVIIPYACMDEMYERFPEMNKVGRLLLEQYYAASEERVFICRIPSAQMRYKHFIQSRPELANRLPIKHIASYLGITLETLSRLRSKAANKV